MDFFSYFLTCFLAVFVGLLRCACGSISAPCSVLLQGRGPSPECRVGIGGLPARLRFALGLESASLVLPSVHPIRYPFHESRTGPVTFNSIRFHSGKVNGHLPNLFSRLMRRDLLRRARRVI